MNHGPFLLNLQPFHDAMTEMRKIILLIDCSSEYDRRLLRGLVQYSKEHGPWLFYRMPSDLIGDLNGGEYVIDWAKKWGADAIVGRWRWDDASILSTLDIPIVLQNYKQRSSLFSNLTGQYFETGKIAAGFFLERGYKNLAYFGVRGVVWSEERMQGFRHSVDESGGTLNFLIVDNYNKERDKVVSWLHSLAKPTALFACDDAYALFLSETCKVENIQVPNEISILGVDNDELLCQISDPQISSIELKVEEGGYILGEVLDKEISSSGSHSFSLAIKPGEVIERGSTKIFNICDPRIDEVVKFIDRNYDRGITMEDILGTVPMSRRSLEVHFKKEFGNMTIYQYLLRLRIKKFASLLGTSNLSLEQISSMSGLSYNSNISRNFKKYYGCSPREYREKAQKE